MKLKILRGLPIGLIALGLLLIASFYLQPVTLWIDGEPHAFRGFVFTSTGALRATGLPLAAEDRLDPPLGDWIPPDGMVRLERARPVWLWIDGTQAGFLTPERIPANWLARAHVPLFPGDRVLVDGVISDPLKPISHPGPYTLQVRQAVAIQVNVGDKKQTVYTAESTLGAALWAAGLGPRPEDRLSLPLSAPIQTGLSVTIRPARELTVRVSKQEIPLRSAADTVGEALRAAGLAPQGLDTTFPPESSPLPADGLIRLVRVSETVALAEKLVPFQKHTTLSADLELDQRQVIQAGQYGVQMERERLRLEDGAEAGRTKEGSWTAAAPRDQITGIGTRAVPHTLDTGGGTVEYYRAVSVYATSYSPCQQGYDHCSRSTSSGTLLKKGVVAVTLAWYHLLAGSRVYIPGYGYGVIADVGGGIPGTYWMDLGYSDEDYQQWNQNVTIYFLTPAPASTPAMLP